MNIGNPRELSVLALAELIRDLASSQSEIRFVEQAEDDPKVRQPDVKLAHSVLAWEPHVPLELGLRRTIAWFRNRIEWTTTRADDRLASFQVSDQVVMGGKSGGATASGVPVD
jgi:dTDP-glucose 4,6-dehydratase